LGGKLFRTDRSALELLLFSCRIPAKVRRGFCIKYGVPGILPEPRASPGIRPRHRVVIVVDVYIELVRNPQFPNNSIVTAA
jgi:hypothetical protein